MATEKKVTLVVVNPCKINGEHAAQGQILTDLDPELAYELTGAGRTRLATDEDIAAAKKAAKKTAEA